MTNLRKDSFQFANKNGPRDATVWTPPKRKPGETYAIDGTTGQPVKSTWPKCGHTCKECWPEEPEVS